MVPQASELKHGREASDVPGMLDGSGLARLGPLNSRSDLVGQAIRTAIVRGELPPGSTLVERRIADMLGVSKTPVREALIGLARSGLVTMNANRGVTVRTVNASALRSIFEVRLRLEPWALGHAVENFSAEVLDEARATMSEAHEAIERDDTGALTLVNRRFHRILYSRCGNDLVCSILDDLQDQLALGVVALIWQESPTWSTEAEEHEEILAAVAAGEAERAEALLHTHIERSYRLLEQGPPR